MFRKKYPSIMAFLGVGFTILLILASSVRAEYDSGYDLTWYIVSNGGVTFRTVDDYTLHSTIGQPVVGVNSEGNYTLGAGFWGGGGEAPPACTEVTNVDLNLVTSGVIYTDTVVEFSADVMPNNASKPYTYTVEFSAIDQGDGVSTTATSSDDPLTMTHTFTDTGTYDVEIAVWNCAMTEAEAVTDTVQVVVSEQGVTCVEVTGIDLSLVTSGVIYTDTEVTFSADVAPDNAGKPYTYTIDYGAGSSAPATSSADPLTMMHTFTDTGAYEVEIAVWNCAMSAAQAKNDSVTLTVSERAAHKIYLPLIVRE